MFVFACPFGMTNEKNDSGHSSKGWPLDDTESLTWSRSLASIGYQLTMAGVLRANVGGVLTRGLGGFQVLHSLCKIEAWVRVDVLHCFLVKEFEVSSCTTGKCLDNWTLQGPKRAWAWSSELLHSNISQVFILSKPMVKRQKSVSTRSW